MSLSEDGGGRRECDNSGQRAAMTWTLEQMRTTTLATTRALVPPPGGNKPQLHEGRGHVELGPSPPRGLAPFDAFGARHTAAAAAQGDRNPPRPVLRGRSPIGRASPGAARPALARRSGGTRAALARRSGAARTGRAARAPLRRPGAARTHAWISTASRPRRAIATCTRARPSWRSPAVTASLTAAPLRASTCRGWWSCLQHPSQPSGCASLACPPHARARWCRQWRLGAITGGRHCCVLPDSIRNSGAWIALRSEGRSPTEQHPNRLIK